ncbi:MAG: hypothetical protein ACE5HO_01280 [bacterium]
MRSLWGVFRGKLIIPFLLFCVVTGCARSTRKDVLVTSEDWSSHADYALSLSQAILKGMRQLEEDLLISELGFEGIDLTIKSTDHLILRAKVTDFKLQEQPQENIFTTWKIYLISNHLMDYVNAVSFDSATNNHAATTGDSKSANAAYDSLTINIYSPSSRLHLENGHTPSAIEVIYWRDFSKKDRLATLRMRKNAYDRFVIDR